ncbi:class I SAM-dependent methyltransferase [Sneathiella glossodoripedis]|uniref:class I SAM-dependent methyltransferase n=1 Tax=Sneathiella glossodoripedis TaxID=418853 RepID=UPI000471E53F|nr:methionine biosynthesis protein MetW [Sneathiella glossodoripedis]
MDQKNNIYYGYVRSDVLRYVPHTANSILSIGCGFGRTEKVLIEQGKKITGIEPSEEAAPIAESNGLRVIRKTAQEGLDELANETFDCVMLSDVLEHLTEPQQILLKCSELLPSGAKIIISVPNFRHYSVFFHLFIKGTVPNRTAGIFDNTHLQITTMKRVKSWIKNVGATTEKTEYKFSGRLEKWLSKITLGVLDEFLAPQVLLCAKKN